MNLRKEIDIQEILRTSRIGLWRIEVCGVLRSVTVSHPDSMLMK